MERSFKRITLKEAKEYAKMLGCELLDVCPSCEFYLLTERIGIGKPERIVTTYFVCESKRKEQEQRRRERELGKHTLTYVDCCKNTDGKCYVFKKI